VEQFCTGNSDFLLNTGDFTVSDLERRDTPRALDETFSLIWLLIGLSLKIIEFRSPPVSLSYLKQVRNYLKQGSGFTLKYKRQRRLCSVPLVLLINGSDKPSASFILSLLISKMLLCLSFAIMG